MNSLIQTVAEAGLSQTIYDIFFVLGFVSVFLFVVFLGWKMGIKLWKCALVVLIVYPLMVLWMFILFWIETGRFGGNNIVRVFVYGPVFAYLAAKILKLQWKDVCAMISIGPAAVHGVSHLGCMFPGCCHGFPSAWGLYSIRAKQILFPIQPIEAIIAWLIIIYLLIRAKKRSYVADGKEYPIMLIMFGSTRFICEFFRDNPKLWLGCSSLAFHALFMCIVGIIALVVINQRYKKANAAALEAGTHSAS